MSSNIIIVEQKQPRKFSPKNLAASRNSVYFHMLKAGVNTEAVKQKMIVLGRVEKPLAENLVNYLITLLNSEENFNHAIDSPQEERVRYVLKKSTTKVTPKAPKLSEKDVENCSYFRMLKSGVPSGAVVQKMVVLERINQREAEETVDAYLAILNPPKEVSSKTNEISQSNFQSFYQMVKSGVPSLAVKQKMIVVHKISCEKADKILEQIFELIDCSSDQKQTTDLFLSENIIVNLPSTSPSSDRPQFKSDRQSEIKMVEIKENNQNEKSNAKFIDEKNINKNLVAKYDTYLHMIKVGMKSDVVKQRMKVDGVPPEKVDQIVFEIFDQILSTISSSSIPNTQKNYGEKLYRSMIKAGVPRGAVRQRLVIVDKLLPDVAERFLSSIETN